MLKQYLSMVYPIFVGERTNTIFEGHTSLVGGAISILKNMSQWEG